MASTGKLGTGGSLLSIDVVMYAILLLSVGFIGWVEKQDLSCPDVFSPESQCAEGKGMPFRGTEPRQEDDCNTLLDKAEKASGVEERSIKWRRSFVLGAVISFLFWILIATPGCLPSWEKMYMSVIICFATLYFSMNFFAYHTVKKAASYAKVSVSEIRNKKCSFT